MKTIRNIYMLLLALSLSLHAHAQQRTNVGNTHAPGYWIFGINAGLSYQSSNVPTTLDGFGLGLTLGKNLYYQPGSVFAFDLRGRLLYARQYGLDTKPLATTDLLRNPTLNGTFGPNYTNIGLAYLNHKTTTGELALEGLLTFNRLRERTNIHLALFGGLGLVGYGAYADQVNAQGQEYAQGYSGIDTRLGNTAIRRDLRSLLDGTYETAASNERGADFNVTGALNLGLELGYHLSPNFLLYVGHRTAYTGTDYLDATPMTDMRNDRYHYTHLGLRWLIQPDREKPLSRAPEIDIISPLGSPFTTNSANGLVVANIRYINSAADVDCIVNGRSTPFSFSQGRFSLDSPLRPGSNEVTIVARNAYGQDRKTIVLVYQDNIIADPPRQQAPMIRFISPTTSSEYTGESDFGIRASIDHVSNRRDVTFTVNGASRDFNFDNGILRANIPLREGDNRVQIRASNAAGSDVSEVTIIRETRLPAPIVNITEPTGGRAESIYNTTRVSASLRHVASRGDITFTVNGRNVWGFNYDENRGLFTADINLDAGANTVVITARNQTGEARDEVTIVYRAPQPQVFPPSVRMIEPARNTSTTTQATARIEAIVTNINNRNDITFSVNGNRRTDFNFDSSSGRLVANVNLLIGNNDIIIRALNRDGEDRQSVAIRRIEEQVNPPRLPVVRINSPANNSETESPTTDIRASIENVSSAQDITFTVNGRNVSNFNFNRGQFMAQTALEEGNNTIRIRATNRDGADEQTINIRYRRAQLLPVVRITAPTNNSETANATAQLRATVEHVDTKDQINLLVNGRSTSNFNFDRNRREVTATLTLNDGNNTIRLEVRNNGGNANDQVNVRYRRATPPTVSISAPANNSSTERSNVTLGARVTNVSNRNDIVLRLNGNSVTNFNWNGSELNAELTLREGANTISVRAVNADGSDEQSVTVRYQPAPRPLVTITDPSSSPFNINANTYLVKARVQHVSSINDITVRVNGVGTRVFNFDTKSGELTLRTMNLRQGDNDINIRATNSAGAAEASLVLRYAMPQPPVVTITEPQQNGNTNQNRIPVMATITNVSKPQDVTFQVNGATITAFTLNGSTFAASADLKAGENTILISARNTDGRDEATVKVTYTPPIVTLPTPSVRITQPARAGVTVDKNTYTLQATLINVAVREEITLWVNGKEWADFNYDAKKGQLTSELTLTPDTNTVRIRVQNRAGSNEAQTSILYKPKAGTIAPPVINIESISQPTVNPFRPQEGSSTIIAKIDNIKGRENVKIFVNSVLIDDFSYNLSSKRIEATVQLKRGTNQVIIIATNEGGSTEESRTVEF